MSLRAASRGSESRTAGEREITVSRSRKARLTSGHAGATIHTVARQAAAENP